MVKAKKRTFNISKKNKRNLNKSNRKNKKRNRSRRRKNQLQSGGKWGSWEGANTMNHPLANIVYNRFVRAPFLTEMGDLSPYN
tara:strand:- start:1368 stop:1616 length:249 start_codon:yes stop_codon:yes gene_type:complete